MASDINSRLSQLRARRKGDSSAASFTEALTAHNRGYTADAAMAEDWEQRGKTGESWTRYAIGAMEAVSKRYTEISVETGMRVANQLRDRLATSGTLAEFKLQGSVPLNVHIKGVSDVDLLSIDTGYLTYDTTGIMAQRGHYRYPSKLTPGEVLSSLRQKVESALSDAFPAATVDKTSAKAVKMTGGSLARAVDVVPSIWYDTEAYQASQREEDRTVRIYNKHTGAIIDNLPFLHIDRVGARCDGIKGGLRTAIRLCKNIKADSDRDIQLSSYDIAAIMYHADMNALRLGQFSDLAVLAEAQRHLDALYRDPATANGLWVPDGTRQIFDSPEKRGWLASLSLELDELLKNVYRENYPSVFSPNTSDNVQRELVKSLTV
jgi:hypothetical protein